MIKINAPKGLGDAIYLRAIILRLLEQGEKVTVFTRWPDVFHDLQIIIKSLRDLEAEDDLSTMRHAAYSSRAQIPEGFDEFTIRCKKAGVNIDAKMELKWPVRNKGLLHAIKEKAAGRKIFIYQPLKVPFNPWMTLMLPNRKAYINFIKQHQDHFRVKLGHPGYVDSGDDMPCELNLYGKGFILDTFDVCTIGDLFFGEICFMPTIGEALDKNVVCMFSRKGLNSDTWVRYLTPERFFHKKHLARAVYDE